MSFEGWKRETNAALRQMQGQSEDEVYAKLRQVASEQRLSVSQQTDDVLRDLARQCANGSLAQLS